MRGIALLGILLITMPKFALPEGFAERILKEGEGLNFRIAHVMNILFDGKMRAVFSMIFGAGILLFIGSKEKAGSLGRIFYSRMFWLAMFGLFHSHILLSGGDILYPYALCGMVLFFFRNTKPTWALAAVLSIIMLEMAINTYYYNRGRTELISYNEAREVERKGLTLTDAQLKAKATWAEHEKWFVHDDKMIDKNIEVMRSSYGAIAANMRETLIAKQTRRAPFTMVDPIALMFLGMVLFRSGFFSGKFGKKTYIRSLILCYGIGIPLAMYSWSIYARFPNVLEFMESHAYNIRIYIHPIQRTLIALGHVSLIILLIRLHLFKRFFHAVAAVGKMAFTNYILQTVLSTMIFLGYGLGYFAQLEYYQLYYVVIAIWVVQLIISPLWLKYFQYGPLEWAWRSLTYWRLQPILLSTLSHSHTAPHSSSAEIPKSLYQKSVS